MQLFRSHLKTPFLILLILETSVIFSTVYGAVMIRFYGGGLDVSTASEGLFTSALIITVITTLTMLSTGLYVGRLREGMAGVLIRISISLLMSSGLVGLTFYMLPELSLWRGVLAISYTLSFFMIGTIRAVFLELVDVLIQARFLLC